MIVPVIAICGLKLVITGGSRKLVALAVLPVGFDSVIGPDRAPAGTWVVTTESAITVNPLDLLTLGSASPR